MTWGETTPRRRVCRTHHPRMACSRAAISHHNFLAATVSLTLSVFSNPPCRPFRRARNIDNVALAPKSVADMNDIAMATLLMCKRQPAPARDHPKVSAPINRSIDQPIDCCCYSFLKVVSPTLFIPQLNSFHSKLHSAASYWRNNS